MSVHSIRDPHGFLVFDTVSIHLMLILDGALLQVRLPPLRVGRETVQEFFFRALAFFSSPVTLYRWLQPELHRVLQIALNVIIREPYVMRFYGNTDSIDAHLLNTAVHNTPINVVIVSII